MSLLRYVVISLLCYYSSPGRAGGGGLFIPTKQVHELLACLGLVEGSTEVAGGGDGVLFLYTTHLHAHVLGFYDHHDSKRLKCLLDAVLDLLRESFLHLQAVAVDVHHAGNLRETRDIAVGNVGYVCLAIEGEHVVLTKREHIDVFDDHHLVVFLFEECVGKHLMRVLCVAACQQLYDRTGQENEDLKEWRELQARWNQFGAFIPLFRAHGQWPLREIWNIAPDEHPAYKSFVYYDQLRYRLMPYLYSLAGWAHFKDYTLMRALVMDFNGDANVLNIGNQWMFGPALMACPVGYYKARNRSVYFPEQCDWYDLYTGEHIEGGQSLVVDAPYERIPVFVREGAIIPFGPQMEWSDEKPAELINLYVYAGQDGTFQLYEDEGTNYNYEKGKYATIDIRYDDSTRTVSFGKRQGSFPGMLKNRRFNIVLITPDQARPLDLESPQGTMVEYSGKPVSVKL